MRAKYTAHVLLDLIILFTFACRTKIVKFFSSFIFWNMTPCSLLRDNWRFRGTYSFHLQDGRINKPSKKPACCRLQAIAFLHGSFFDAEDGGVMFFLNVGWLLTDCTTSYARSHDSLYPPFWERQILRSCPQTAFSPLLRSNILLRTSSSRCKEHDILTVPSICLVRYFWPQDGLYVRLQYPFLLSPSSRSTAVGN